MFLIVWSLMEISSIYRVFKKRHLLFDDRFTMTMCTAVTMMSAFVCALHIELLLPANQDNVMLLPVLVGLLIGWKFGSIIKSSASLNGIYNGAIGGIMGMMLGAVLKNPALCKIPIETEAMIASNMYSLALFATVLLTFINWLVRHSFKV